MSSPCGNPVIANSLLNVNVKSHSKSQITANTIAVEIGSLLGEKRQVTSQPTRCLPFMRRLTIAFVAFLGLENNRNNSAFVKGSAFGNNFPSTISTAYSHRSCQNFAPAAMNICSTETKNPARQTRKATIGIIFPFPSAWIRLASKTPWITMKKLFRWTSWLISKSLAAIAMRYTSSSSLGVGCSCDIEPS